MSTEIRLLLRGLQEKDEEGAAMSPPSRSETGPRTPAPSSTLPIRPQGGFVATDEGPLYVGNVDEVVGGNQHTLEDWFWPYTNDYHAQESDNGWIFRDTPLRSNDLYEHLQGSKTLGLYPIDKNNNVMWCGFDIDTEDVSTLYSLLGNLDGPYIQERTGGRGWHVWVFFETPQSASKVRQWALGVSAGLQLEVYPKQDFVGPTRPGQNLLRLPFGVHRKTGKQSYIEYGEFGYYTLPDISTAEVQPVYRYSEGEAGWIEDLFNGEAPNGRNNGLNRLRFWLLKRGFPDEVIIDVVTAANEKQLPEPLGKEELWKILRLQ